ncbi:uncharacterized protein [Aegilops tauschii subsp. strangulata]
MKKIKTYYMCALAPLPVQGRWRCLPAPPVHCCRTATGLVEDIEPGRNTFCFFPTPFAVTLPRSALDRKIPNHHLISSKLKNKLNSMNIGSLVASPVFYPLGANVRSCWPFQAMEQRCTKKREAKQIVHAGKRTKCQISYFEFLIITRFKLPTIEPRLPLWSTNMLNSYVALNVLHGKSNEYSRLLIKHISYTIFSDSAFVELPEEMLRVY